MPSSRPTTTSSSLVVLLVLSFVFACLVCQASADRGRQAPAFAVGKWNQPIPHHVLLSQKHSEGRCNHDESRWKGLLPHPRYGSYPGSGPAVTQTMGIFYFLYSKQGDPQGTISTPTKEPVSTFATSAIGMNGPVVQTWWSTVTNKKLKWSGVLNSSTTADAFGWIPTAANFTCGNCYCGSDAAYGYAKPSIYASKKLTDASYSKFVWVPRAGDGCGVAGVPGQHSVQQAFGYGAANDSRYNQGVGQGNMVHEVGHNLGLSHAGQVDCSGVNNTLGPGCTDNEYGDWMDFMGGNWGWGIYNTAIKVFKGYLPETSIQAFTTTQNLYYIFDSTYPSVLNVADNKYGTKKFAVYNPITNANPFPNFGGGPLLHWITYDVYGSAREQAFVSVRYVTDPVQAKKNWASYPRTFLVSAMNQVGQTFEDHYLNLKVVVVNITSQYARVQITRPF